MCPLDDLSVVLYSHLIETVKSGFQSASRIYRIFVSSEDSNTEIRRRSTVRKDFRIGVSVYMSRDIRDFREAELQTTRRPHAGTR